MGPPARSNPTAVGVEISWWRTWANDFDLRRAVGLPIETPTAVGVEVIATLMNSHPANQGTRTWRHFFTARPFLSRNSRRGRIAHVDRQDPQQVDVDARVQRVRSTRHDHVGQVDEVTWRGAWSVTWADAHATAGRDATEKSECGQC